MKGKKMDGGESTRPTPGEMGHPDQSLSIAQKKWGKVLAPGDPESKLFLQGPQRRLSELWQAFRMFFEYIQGFRRLHFVGPCVTVFGSARFPETSPHYQLARDVGGAIARAGFTVMTGGGPGIMEGANRGAREAGGRSIGCNILLPKEQAPNPYLDEFIDFEYFSIRKTMLIKYSYAFFVLPGGLGTLDELFEITTLVQTGKVKDFPVVLMGVSFWQPLIDFMRETLLAEGTIDRLDIDRLVITDDIDFAVREVTRVGMNRFGLSYGPRIRRAWWLGE